MIIKESFFCFRLESTAICIGWVEGVCSAILIIVLAGLLPHMPKDIEWLREEGIPLENTLTIFTGVALFFLCLNVITDFCLVLGTNKGRPNFFLPWLILDGIYFAIHCLSIGVSFYSVPAFITYIVTLTLHFELWNSMWSLHLFIKDARRAAC